VEGLALIPQSALSKSSNTNDGSDQTTANVLDGGAVG
jgi:hypothetical protein